MKKNRAFTLVELVIVLAISTILLGTIAGLSILTSRISAQGKNASLCVSEYQEIKRKIEGFTSSYSYDYYQFVILGEVEFEISNSEDVCVAKLSYNSDTKTLKVYESGDANISVFAKGEQGEILTDESGNKICDESYLTYEKSFSKITAFSIEFDESSNLLKCEVDFEEYISQKFLINLGGMQIGNLY